MTTTEAALKELVAGARQADPDAWEALYRRAYPRLFAYARRRLASEEQAEDAVSETMARAMRRIGAFTWTRAGIDGWLFGIARNVVFETYRDSKRAAPSDLAWLADEAEAHGGDPSDRLVTDEETLMLRTAFDRLTDDDQQLLELRVVIGLDSTQVGAVIGRRPGAVRTAQSRALGRLRAEHEALRA